MAAAERPRLTKAQRALVRLKQSGIDLNYLTREQARLKGLQAEFDLARRGGLVQARGYEPSNRGLRFLISSAGRLALSGEDSDG